MNILICSERFVFRFGVDRVMIMLGQKLKELGHRVTVMANKGDRHQLESFAEQIIFVPQCDDYIKSNRFVAEWCQRNWSELFSDETFPDVVVVTGWPFLEAIPFFNQVCDGVVFSDHGAVPKDGFAGYALDVQLKLRQLRRHYMPACRYVIAVSRFIMESQSIPTVGDTTKCLTILNGGDHLAQNVWDAVVADDETGVLETIGKLKSEGKKLVLILGRWETNCYKNSEAALVLVDAIKERFPEVVLLVLAQDADLGDADRSHLCALGFPSDDELKQVMSECLLGISTSLWEGFNLPLAEMQMVNKPVLVFNVGAHPEVVSDPWLICADERELADKCMTVLAEKHNRVDLNVAMEVFKENMTWESCLAQYGDFFGRLAEEVSEQPTRNSGLSKLVFDVTNACVDPANSGVIRVTRRLGRELQGRFNPLFVVWSRDRRCYVLPTPGEAKQLRAFNGPIVTNPRCLSPIDGPRIELVDVFDQVVAPYSWLLLTETARAIDLDDILPIAKALALQTAIVFHDAIPILRPELCNVEVTENHGAYMTKIAQFDVVLPISNYSATCLTDFWRTQSVEVNTCCEVNLLPGEFKGQRRVLKPKPLTDVVRILCVSTLEPRKNHINLIRALLQLKVEMPHFKWQLTLVGNRYAGNDEIPEFVEKSSQEHPEIEWLGVVDDETLANCYKRATITVYPSEIEGFGMPIMESIWYGTTCLCHNDGVMAELASDGGCVTVDMKNVDALAKAIFETTSSSAQLVRLGTEAVARSVKTWPQFANRLASVLCRYRLAKPDAPTEEEKWDAFFYKGFMEFRANLEVDEALFFSDVFLRLQPENVVLVANRPTRLALSISKHIRSLYCVSEKKGFFDSHFSNEIVVPEGSLEMSLRSLLSELSRREMGLCLVVLDWSEGQEGCNHFLNVLLNLPELKQKYLVHKSSLLGTALTQSDFVEKGVSIPLTIKYITKSTQEPKRWYCVFVE